jgi:5-carboxyvanillate decarboxylase
MGQTRRIEDPGVLAFCITKLGAKNIMFAIDYPYEDSATATRFLADAPITPEQRALISHSNAEHWFRIKPETA